ncbi:hypothetical protein KXV95_001375 [Aspergillus fumigatus]|nr:hypothetical protein KXX44_005926 [Aspergillus fumigatus]KAH1626493.1 hypothetical protein KXX39_005499 [Aspergillus fumigatus]KAH1686284.1 hypothetical protein KXX23_005171 [Aspergillus fumigatus]KAH1937592.1 hypothetical protein KXV48_007378 [Aspergillus fumigatus]KAH1959391.1 hypothetical protein KXV59_006650 [Aspergillus fumigatus]
MPFEFIDNHNDLSHNDAARKRIRSHAALGKNRGKKIMRPSTKGVSTTTITSFRIPFIMRGDSKAKRQDPTIERPIDDGLIFPGLLPGESKGIVKEAVISFLSSMGFSPELSNGLDYGELSAPVCVQNMFVDEACFHSTMATALLCLDNLVSKPDGKLQAMRHASNTFCLLQQKISLQSVITDLTIAAVIGQSGLGEKILRVDLEYALQLGTPTLFRLEEAEWAFMGMRQFSDVHAQPNGKDYFPRSQQHILGSLPINLRDLFLDVLFLASSLNNAMTGDSPKLGVFQLHQNIILLGYRLVKLKPLGLPLRSSSLENRVHLGLAAFLASFLQGWDGQISPNHLLSRSLLASVHQHLSAEQNEQELSLWALFRGAVLPSSWNDSTWVLKTRVTLKALGIDSWGDIRDILGKYPWVNAIHDPPGQTLWYRCLESL